MQLEYGLTKKIKNDEYDTDTISYESTCKKRNKGSDGSKKRKAINIDKYDPINLKSSQNLEENKKKSIYKSIDGSKKQKHHKDQELSLDKETSFNSSKESKNKYHQNREYNLENLINHNKINIRNGLENNINIINDVILSKLELATVSKVVWSFEQWNQALSLHRNNYPIEQSLFTQAYILISNMPNDDNNIQSETIWRTTPYNTVFLILHYVFYFTSKLNQDQAIARRATTAATNLLQHYMTSDTNFSSNDTIQIEYLDKYISKLLHIETISFPESSKEKSVKEQLLIDLFPLLNTTTSVNNSSNIHSFNECASKSNQTHDLYEHSVLNTKSVKEIYIFSLILQLCHLVTSHQVLTTSNDTRLLLKGVWKVAIEFLRISNRKNSTDFPEVNKYLNIMFERQLALSFSTKYEELNLAFAHGQSSGDFIHELVDLSPNIFRGLDINNFLDKLSHKQNDILEIAVLEITVIYGLIKSNSGIIDLPGIQWSIQSLIDRNMPKIESSKPNIHLMWINKIYFLFKYFCNHVKTGPVLGLVQASIIFSFSKVCELLKTERILKFLTNSESVIYNKSTNSSDICYLNKVLDSESKSYRVKNCNTEKSFLKDNNLLKLSSDIMNIEVESVYNNKEYVSLVEKRILLLTKKQLQNIHNLRHITSSVIFHTDEYDSNLLLDSLSKILYLFPILFNKMAFIDEKVIIQVMNSFYDIIMLENIGHWDIIDDLTINTPELELACEALLLKYIENYDNVGDALISFLDKYLSLSTLHSIGSARSSAQFCKIWFKPICNISNIYLNDQNLLSGTLQIIQNINSLYHSNVVLAICTAFSKNGPVAAQHKIATTILSITSFDKLSVSLQYCIRILASSTDPDITSIGRFKSTLKPLSTAFDNINIKDVYKRLKKSFEKREDSDIEENINLTYTELSEIEECNEKQKNLYYNSTLKRLSSVPWKKIKYIETNNEYEKINTENVVNITNLEQDMLMSSQNLRDSIAYNISGKISDIKVQPTLWSAYLNSTLALKALFYSKGSDIETALDLISNGASVSQALDAAKIALTKEITKLYTPIKIKSQNIEHFTTTSVFKSFNMISNVRSKNHFFNNDCISEKEAQYIIQNIVNFRIAVYKLWGEYSIYTSSFLFPYCSNHIQQTSLYDFSNTLKLRKYAINTEYLRIIFPNINDKKFCYNGILHMLRKKRYSLDSPECFSLQELPEILFWLQYEIEEKTKFDLQVLFTDLLKEKNIKRVIKTYKFLKEFFPIDKCFFCKDTMLSLAIKCPYSVVILTIGSIFSENSVDSPKVFDSDLLRESIILSLKSLISKDIINIFSACQFMAVIDIALNNENIKEIHEINIMINNNSELFMNKSSKYFAKEYLKYKLDNILGDI